jgi:hypothetical protein
MERTIVAVRDIPPGESITWNYGGVNLIPAGYVSRNMTLAYHFRFACFCDRCRDEMPDNLRGQPDLFKYFQIWLTELEKPVG